MSNKHLQRIRRICATLPETTEKLSHGEPTFFVHKKVFAMFSNNHHRDGHIAVVLPAPPGIQAMLMRPHRRNSTNRLTLACAVGLASSLIASATKSWLPISAKLGG